MRHLERTAACLTALIAVLATTLPSPPASATATAAYTVWHWNVAGNKMHHGSTSDGMVAGAVASILNRDADLVAFNELCWGQYRSIQAELRSGGWPADPTNYSRFATILGPTPGVCDGNENYGNAIFSKRPLGPASRFTLPSDGSREQRNLLCGHLLDAPRVRFCTTHITPSNAIGDNGQKHNVNQLTFVLDRLEGYGAEGDTVIIAGDFNAQPHYGRLNTWYSSTLDTAHNSGNTGHYRELDDNDLGHCPGYGEWTATGTPSPAPPCAAVQPRAKIDMIFVRQDRIAGPYMGDSLGISTSCTGIPATEKYPAGSCSDHRILFGTVTVTAG
ncbi:endonuclease/exonuclease/phosphatase family protein [Nonomuraea deserti]|uniref:endonuclease/exonuclease/phosphatase family protein n=1 Tax=Nonomuraea deserti TaxID=1848322 RepID=UPI001C70AEF1|nr:endonuclease/exonuclease/phosphatase family protein [Nonomuraea deserti]